MSQRQSKPNVIFIIMDDLCYGDLGSHGNPYISTPNLDKMREESTHLDRYSSGPLCSPARASVLTGRYHLRTRVVDTYCGRSMIDPEEKIMAQSLQDQGYRTACFGKWHLGDNAPSRPQDLGFEKVIMHKGGGIGQPGDHPANLNRESYFDPYLYEDGVAKLFKGYCTDIFTDATIDFVKEHRAERFFVYLATNAPHEPLQISDQWADKYRDMKLPEEHARIYGMIENIDWNVGRIFSTLKELGIDEQTLVVFTSDHGPCPGARAKELPEGQQDRYNAGLRGIKGSVYEGGIKVPSFWRWPGVIMANQGIQEPTHAIDVMPTIMEMTKTAVGDEIDGVSLYSSMNGGIIHQDIKDRCLFMQWHRGDTPIAHRNCAVISGSYKLLRQAEVGEDELYNLDIDPGEQQNVADEYPSLVSILNEKYEAWFIDVSSTRPENYAPPPIHIGGPLQSLTELTRQDWRMPGLCDGWSDQQDGHWVLDVRTAGSYDIMICFADNIPHDMTVCCTFGSKNIKGLIRKGEKYFNFNEVSMVLGKTEMKAWGVSAVSLIPVHTINLQLSHL